jgi:hypothetical protein
MSGHPLRSDLIELAREQSLRLRRLGPQERKNFMAQWKICQECERFLEEQLALTEAMNDLAAEAMAAIPPAIGSMFDALPQPSRGHPALRPSLRIAAVVAALAAGLAWVWAVHRVAPRQHPGATVRKVQPATPEAVATALPEQSPIPPASGTTARNNSAAKAVAKRSPESPIPEDAFVQIPYTLPLDPRERIEVRRMEIPVAALAAAGLTAALPDPRASAQTDVLVGEDGRIRAVRLVSISGSYVF